MSIYKTVKAAVSTRDAAEFYGFSVNRYGKMRCPFHDDRNPSMKVDERFYCFGCQETGDVIDFVARIFNLRPYEAARKLMADFHIDPNTPPAAENPAIQMRIQEYQAEIQCIRALVEYEALLKHDKERFAPAITDEFWHERFVTSISTLPVIDHYLSELYCGDPVIRKMTVKDLIDSGMIKKIEQALTEARKEKNNHEHEQSCRAA